MARATLNWTLPTTRVNGAALTPAEIDRTDIMMSADGGNTFSTPVQVPSDAVQTFVIDNLDPGDYVFRAIVIDTDGRASASADVTGAVLAAPSAIGDLTVTIE